MSASKSPPGKKPAKKATAKKAPAKRLPKAAAPAPAKKTPNPKRGSSAAERGHQAPEDAGSIPAPAAKTPARLTWVHRCPAAIGRPTALRNLDAGTACPYCQKPAPAAKASKPPKAAQPQAPATDTTAQLMRRRGAQDQRQERPLTDTEEAFLTEYMRNGQNGTAAWIFIHPGTPPGNAAVNAYALLRKPQVKARLEAERQRLAKKHEIDRDSLLQEFLAIVRANPNDLTQIRRCSCSACWGGKLGEEHQGRWIDADPECPTCMGDGIGMPWFADTRRLSPEAMALYAGVQQTKEGVKVLMHDKMAALVNIGKILGAYEEHNKQKDKGTAEALREFFAGMHGNRLPIAKHEPKADAPAGPGHPLVRA